jgi:hypothetical protein
VPESSTTGLTVGQTYYWRIDERSAANLLKGKVWSFTIGEFLVVDDFDGYANQNELYAVWDDYWVNGSGAFIYLETDVNYIRDGNSVRFAYDNDNYYKLGSYMDSQDPAELQVGVDWTRGGVKALTLYFFGDPCNVIEAKYENRDRLWAELEDTGTNAGVVKHTDVNDMRESIWHEWNIALSDFSDAGVDLSNLDRVTVGIGGPKGGQSGAAKAADKGIWIDDIRLYPPRCLPELGLSSEADFTGDCVVDSCDLDVMATDWLLQDGDTPTEKRPATLTGFADATSHWTTDSAVGSGAIILDANSRIDVTDPRLNGVAAMSMTCWVKQTISNVWVGLICSREDVGCGDDATEIGIYGGQYGGPGADALGYDWSCGTEEWQWDAGLDVPTDGTWTFVAIVVDPNGGQLYMRPITGSLQTGVKNTAAHATQQNFSEGFYIGRSKVGGGGPFVGKMDDVRIYDRALSYADVCDIALQVADPNPWPVYHYKFEETTGYTAADSGHPTLVYGPVQSVANLTDPEAKLSRFVNFKDFDIFADDWLKEFMYPPE